MIKIKSAPRDFFRPKNLPGFAILIPLAPLVGIVIVSYMLKASVETTLESLPNAVPPLKPIEASYQASSLKLYNLGFPNSIGGLIWVQLLQNADTKPIPAGQVSWEFTQLDAITTLDPNFERAYSFGAVYLSIFRQDKLGARTILEKWVKRRPNYWKANYFLGHHLFFEMDDPRAASNYILRAATLEGAPAYLSALGVRLMETAEGLNQALRMSCEIYPSLHNAEAKERLALRIKSLLFAIQKSVWEKALVQYRDKFRHDPDNLAALAPFAKLAVRDLAQSFDASADPDLQELLSKKYPFHFSTATRQIEPEQTIKELGLEPLGVHEKAKKDKP